MDVLDGCVVHIEKHFGLRTLTLSLVVAQVGMGKKDCCCFLNSVAIGDL